MRNRRSGVYCMSIQETAVETIGEPGSPAVTPTSDTVTSTSSSVATHPTARRRRRRSRYRHSGEMRRRIVKAVAVGGAAIVVLVVMIMSIGLSSLSAENARLVTENNRKDRALQQAQAELAATQAQRDALVTGRIPRLKPLEYDKAIGLDQSYIRNVIFTLTRASDKTMHEYRMVLHNDSLSVINPNVKIVLFDAVGIQIGMATLNRNAASSDKERTLLDPGEVRSYSGIIPVNGQEKPEYFLVLAD